jgi:hypothetical protein
MKVEVAFSKMKLLRENYYDLKNYSDALCTTINDKFKIENLYKLVSKCLSFHIQDWNNFISEKGLNKNNHINSNFQDNNKDNNCKTSSLG